MQPLTASDKPACRESLKSTLRATTPEERAEWSAAIRARLAESEPWRRAKSVMLFAALRYEPDLTPLLEAAGGRRLIFPSMESDRIVPRAMDRMEDLTISPGGIREPAGGPIVPAAEIDLILIPGLGFTPGGVRLGRGRGHYDRFLRGLRPEVPRVGTAFSCQLRSILPAEPLDVPMTSILTENGLLPVAF